MSCDIDIVTGEVFQQNIDIDLPGVIDVTLSRSYSTTLRKQCSVLGFGWSHSLEIRAKTNEQAVSLHEGYDSDTEYPWDQCDGFKGPRVRQESWKLSLFFPDGSERHFAKISPTEDTYYLIRDQDPHGNAISFAYERGRLVLISTPEGRKVQFIYTAAGFLDRITLVHTFLQQTPLILIHYHMGVNGDLIAVTDYRGFSQAYEYADHLLVAYQNRTGGKVYYAYDRAGRCCRSWQDDEKQIRVLDYDGIRLATLHTDSYGGRTLQRLNNGGLIVEQIDALGYSRQMHHDDNGGFIAMTDEIGLIGETTTYDPVTRQIWEREAGGGEIATEFDELGRVVHMGRPPKSFRTYSYDEHGNLAAITTPDGSTWKLEYDERGQLMCATDANGYTVKQESSQTGDHVRVSDVLGTLEEQEFDTFGNLILYKDAAGQSIRFAYEGPDCFCTETLSDGRTTHYKFDGERNLIELTDPLGNTQRFEHDRFGTVIGEWDATGSVARFEYDKEYNLCRLINKKGEIFESVYDMVGNEIERRFFDGHVQRFAYDARGRRRSMVDGTGGVTRFDYDDADRVIRQVLPDGTVQEFEWDTADHVTRITAEKPSVLGLESQSLVLVYNDDDLITREEHDDYWIERDYDSSGHLMAIRDSWGTATLYRRSVNYDLVAIQEAGRTFECRWNAGGYLQEIVYPNGMRQVFTTDTWGRVTERTMLGKDRAVLAQRLFRYDRGDHLVEISDSRGGILHYAYDQLGRLIRVADAGGTALERYSYDADDNLKESHRGRTEIASGDRITATNGWRLEYDEAGKLISRARAAEYWQFEYDGDDQLIRVLKNGAIVAQYAYDLLNRRMRKSIQKGESLFLYDGYFALRAERRDGTLVRHVYLPGLDIPLACYIGDCWYYYSFDQLGTLTEVWTEQGELCCLLNKESYGTNREVTLVYGRQIDIPFLFPGQYYDEETALCYNTFRYYNPETASYISPDPLSILARLNHYTYPRDPLTWIDPDGLLDLEFTCKNTKKCNWDKMNCAKWIAQLKVEKLNRELENRQLKKCEKCKRSKQRQYYKNKCGGKLKSTHQIDHLHDLQGGGADKCCRNLVSIPSNINNCLGSAIRRTLNSVNKIIPKGTRISIKGCSGGKCKNKEKQFVRPPKQNCRSAKPVC
jgi:RHS repeat-associated protein